MPHPSLLGVRTGPPGLLTLAALMAACSGSGQSAPGGPCVPEASALSTSGKLRVDVCTAPSPPSRGLMTAELTVTDSASGAPQDGLTLEVLPWMPSMGHGTSLVPTVSPAGGGKYVVTNVSLYMPGHWELRTSMSGPVTDSATPAVDVP